MKPRSHYLILMSFLLLVLPLMSEPSRAQSLTSVTESDIRAMINELDRATKKGNVAGILAPLAPESKIKITVVNAGSSKEVVGTLSKDQYAFHTKQALRRRIAYHAERKNMRIKIYDAETAMVTSDLYETLKIRQGTIRASSSEVLFVGLRSGKILITGMEYRTRFY